MKITSNDDIRVYVAFNSANELLKVNICDSGPLINDK